MSKDSAILGRLVWMGWACAKAGPPTDKDLAAALLHYCKKYGRPCPLVAERTRNGLTPPPGVELVGWATVPAGCLYLALPGGDGDGDKTPAPGGEVV